ncbi:MAG: FAD-binding oxidoreductase [Chloroflexi bacterium]|nr:FAD-binding oxidoreductase [Chloroflexota bacterium]
MPNVVIVGGGAMGASIAYHLAAKGVKDVVLLERENALAMGSTGRSVGGIRHQFSSAVNIRLSLGSVAKYKRFNDEIGPADFHWVGYCFLLDNEGDVLAFQRNASLQQSLGVPVELITPAQAQEFVPQLNVDDILAATICFADGFGDPSAVALGYAGAARRLGADIRTNTAVIGVRVDGGRVKAVRTERDEIEAEWVIDAAGPWAAAVAAMAGVELPIVPLRRQVFITEPFDLMPPMCPMVIDFSPSFYFRREGPALLIGMADKSEPPGFQTQWDASFRDKVIEQAIHRVPVIESARIARGWGGLYDTTPDANPIIGPVPEVENFLVAAGFSGHGFMHSPMAGQLIAEMICGEAPAIDVGELSVLRFRAGQAPAEKNVI